ncbi:MAG: DEAD/DEAH box helicase family protein [Candidatus Izemoplasmatales bacterium]|nr:DEAD/DEAH box helicase family protein [Candidatus Izemoplasmatales bacterium]
MNFNYLEGIEELSNLYETLTSSNIAEPFLRCIKYGRNIEQLVRYTYKVKFPKNNVANSEIIKLIKDKDFKNFLGKTEYYDKIHFIYLAGNNAAFDHDMDKETADLAFESLKEVTYLIFSKIKEFDEIEESTFKYVVPSNMAISEAKTRELYIDVNLKNAKYKINKYKDHLGHGKPGAGEVCLEIEVHNLPNQNVGYADYVIYGKTGLPIAIIEAKRTSKSEEQGAQQARDYADALKKELNLKYRPIIYYTNGYVIKIQDRLGYPARTVANFASLDDLELMIKRQLPGDEDKRKPIVDKTVDTTIINRSKLIEAVQELIDSMNTDGKMRRKGLLVLPCGVGKTRTAVALSKILLKNDWAQNILFLADRNNLVSNAVKPFKQYIDGVVSDISAENPDRDIKARVCICTYPSMLSFINKPDKEFSVGHFDLIIVDEAHRSLFNVYRAIFEYFDAFIIGLTATPSKALDRSTYEILDLKKDEPTFELKFEEAVNLEYLVNYKAFDKTSKILTKGIKYSDLSDDEKEEFEKYFSGETDIPAIEFKKTINSTGTILNETTIDEMFADLFKYGLRVDSGNRIGKTLIFARDHKHAEKIVERFKHTYPQLGDDFCQVIDNQINKNKTRQDNFAKKDSNPHIVVSVDMMDTGVDIPEIVNLVFFKNVMSRIKFDQMWGRGTRTCKGLKVISPSKDYFEGRSKDDSRIEYEDKQGFFVFDYCGNFQFFDEHPEGNDPSTCLNLNQKIYSVSIDVLANLQDIKYQENPVFKAYYDSLKNKLVDKIKKLDVNRIDVHSKLYYVDKFKDITAWTCLSDKDIFEIKTNLLGLIDPDTTDDTGYKSWTYKLSIVQLSILDSRVDSKKQQLQMVGIAKALLKKASISDVYAKKDALKEITEEDYYKNLDFHKIEALKDELGPLMKYLDDGGDPITYLTSFNDKIETNERDCKYDFDDFRTYREKFIVYLQKHYGELKSLNKILNLEELGADDLKELQNILDSLKRTDDKPLFKNSEELIIFIRKIVGLDRKVIDEKCASFLNANDFNKEQRNLINLIIDFAIRNGNVTNDDLVNSEPFSDFEIPEVFNDLDPLFALLKVFNNPLSVGV